MDEEPPPPSDSPPAGSPQPPVESGEEKHPAILQCEDFAKDLAMEELDGSNDESSIPIVQSPELRSEEGGERRSVLAGGEENPAALEEENPALRQEEEAADGQVLESEPSVEEIMQENLEEKLIVDDSPQPTEELNGKMPETAEGGKGISFLKEEEEKAHIPEASIYGVAVDETAERHTEDRILDADRQPSEESDEEMPQLGASFLRENEEDDKGLISEIGTADEIMHENVEEKLLDVASLLRDNEEEDKGLITEIGTVDEIMHENVEEKLLDVDCLPRAEYLNEKGQPSTEEGEKAYTLEKPSVGDEKGSSPEKESEEKEQEEQVPLFTEIMQGNIIENLQACTGTEPAKQLEEERLHEEVSLLQGKNVGEEEKLVMPEPFGSAAEGEDDEHKLSEEQLDEKKPHSVKKQKKASSSRQTLLEEEEEVKGSSLQEESAAEMQDESGEKDEEESDEKEDADEMDTDEGGPARAAGKRTGSKRKRGRPPVAQGRRIRAPSRPKEDEELCFICFDGGDLVVCDHRGCPKVYHPSCVNRDEAYFKAKGQWTCGWHICSNCQKSARYMCYTCTYSLCRRCIKESEFVCVRENRGFCETCMKIVMQIEMNTRADENTDVIDFDDKTSWMYLFKDYWVDLKAKLSLTIDELRGARNPFKETNVASGNDEPLDKKERAQWNGEPSEKPGSLSDDQGGSSSGSSRRHKECISSKKKAKKRLRNTGNKTKEAVMKRTLISEDVEWASKDLLEFVAHMKDGDTSSLSQFDVQALLLEYIKQNNLRDPRKKSQVVCDSRLQALFGKSRVGHLEMLKLLEPHFLIKESSPLVTDDNQGGVVDPDPSQTDVEGNSDASTKVSLDTGRRSRRRVEERGPTNLDDYAAIDVHNVRLMYLRRNLMEGFLDDIDTFSENVVGSFVRIRISGSASNKDMYRLVQVIGTGKAAEVYKTGKKTTDTTLEILNLNKKEFITIDLISNQEFTEEECKRLRQSVKCGFIHRPAVAEVQEKARALHAVKFDDWLESEKLRLGHLRDRASEKGRRKEHRECVEKLQLLNTPEERIRRLNEVPEVHIDPNRDLDCDSTEDEDDLNIKRQDNNRMRNALFKDRDEFLARRGSSAPWKNPRAQDLNRSTVKPGAQNVVPPTVLAGKTDGFARNQENNINQESSPKMPKSGTNASSMVISASTNALPVIEPGKLPGIHSETASQPTPVNVVSSSLSETEKMWHYQDPAGKIQGPFSMTQLRKWNTSGFFPAGLRIWRTSEKQENSILLTDALSGKFHTDMQCLEPHHNHTNQPASHMAMADTRVNNVGGGVRENNIQHNSASFPTTSNYSGQSDRWTAQTSPLSPDTGRVGPLDRRSATSSTGWESSKNSNALCGQSQSYNSPGPVSPFSRNSQRPSFHGRDGRGENHGRWSGARGHQNNWNSNKHRRFQNNSRGYERQHSYQSSWGQQSSEQWKVQPRNDASTPLGSSSNPPAHASQPNSIDWASLQGAINRILPSASPGQPTSSEMQSQANLTSMAVNSVGGWALNSIPNVNPGMTQETVGVLSNIQPQNRPSETAAQVNSRNLAIYNGSSTPESLDKSNMKLGSNNSNATPTTAQVSSDVQESGSVQPAQSQSNVDPSNEHATNKKCPESHDMSASESKNVDGTSTTLHAASAAGDASGSSDLRQASLSVQRSEASSSEAQIGSQCWAPVSTQKEGPTGLSVNPAQALNMGWGTAPQNTNPTVQQIGNMAYPAVPSAANMGWGMMAHGVMNMTWGTPTNVNMGWVPPAQSPMNANLGWAVPAQGNANANMAWGAQTQANANSGWGMPMQVHAAQNPNWVAPSTVSANPNPCWVAPMEGNANQNASWGTAMKSAQADMNIAANQNGGGGKANSNGDGGSSHPSLPPEQGGNLQVSRRKTLQERGAM